MVVLLWLWGTFHVANLANWFLETALDIICLTTLAATYRRFTFATLSYSLMTVYFAVHFVGAYYTYDHVPFGYVVGHWLGTARNMYDRVVHFSFGLLFYYPIRELMVRTARVQGFWAHYLPLDAVLALSALYEVGEWLTATHTPAHLGATFLAAQGDVWDTQKDMMVAGLGALTFTLGLWLWQHVRQRVRYRFTVRSTATTEEAT